MKPLRRFVVRVEGRPEDELPSIPDHTRASAFLGLADKMLWAQFGLQPVETGEAGTGHVTVELHKDGGAAVNYHTDAPLALTVYIPRLREIRDSAASLLEEVDIFTRPGDEMAEEGTPERQQADKALENDHEQAIEEDWYRGLGTALLDLAGLCPTITLRTHLGPDKGVSVTVETPCGCTLATEPMRPTAALEEAADLASAHMQRAKKPFLDA